MTTTQKPLFSRGVPQPSRFERELVYCVSREIAVSDRIVEDISEIEFSPCMTHSRAKGLSESTGGKLLKWAGFTPYPEWADA